MVHGLDNGIVHVPHLYTSVCGLKLLVYEALSFRVVVLDNGIVHVPHLHTSVSGLKLLVYEASSY